MMSTHNDLLNVRFNLNMGRINGLVKLLFSDFDQFKMTGLFKSDGVRADILRAIVVFLHATFEDILRSHLPEKKQNKKLSFYSRCDIKKALRIIKIDIAPFEPLYNPLTQMAKRRKIIVHDADLLNRTDTVSKTWDVADDWQLIMWLMAVSAFYYQLRMSVNAASVVERTMYERIRKAMLDHVDFGNQLVAFPKLPLELQKEALQKALVTLETIISTLKLDVKDFIVDDIEGIYGFDETKITPNKKV